MRTNICHCRGSVTPYGKERHFSLFWHTHKIKNLVFRNGIYTVLTAVLFVWIFGLASYSYVADRRNKRVTADYGYMTCMFIVIWLNVYIVGLSVRILEVYSFEVVSQSSFIAFFVYNFFIHQQYYGCDLHVKCKLSKEGIFL